MNFRRLSRIGFIFLAFFVVFVSGTYYYQVFPLRVAHHLILSILLTIYALRAWGRGGLPKTPLTIPLLIAILMWIVTSFLSVDPRVSLENAWFPITHTLIAIFLSDLVRRGRDKLVIEVQFLFAAVVMMFALLHLGSWYFGWGIVPGTAVGWADVTAVAPLPLVTPMIYMPLGVSTWLAAYTAPLILLAFGYGMASKQRPVRIGFWLLAAGLLIALIGTFSRGGFVALAAGGAVFVGLRILALLIEGIQKSARRLALPALIAVVGVAAVLGLVFLIGQNAGRFTGDALRFNLWRGAGEIITDHPIVGVGTGMFGRVIREYREPNTYYDDRLGTAHNAYLNTFAENGVIGIAVMLLLGGAIVVAAWHRWRALTLAGNTVSRWRLEAAVAGLAAFGVQSIFDTFAAPPLALLLVVLVVLTTIEPGKSFESPSRYLKGIAAALALLMIVYGVRQFISDSAYGAFRGASDLEGVQSAFSNDPQMGLYQLQTAYLLGQQGDPGADDAYAAALEQSPTWDVGWINRAALAEQRGETETALAYLERASSIDILNGANLQWARLAEATASADDEAIIGAYYGSFGDWMKLPLSGFWDATPLRQAAVERFIEALMPASPDLAYRIAQVHFPERLESLVQALRDDNRINPAANWVYGEDALQRGDLTAAFDYFDRAAREARNVGDYYASRARARIAVDPDDPLIEVDLRLVELLTTIHESPNAIRAEIAADLETKRRLWASAVPLQIVSQNFIALSFGGRVVDFVPYPSMHEPGPGRPVLQPWYDLAQSYLDTNEVERAIAVYRAIIAYAPDETAAAEQLDNLN